jgi:hypothetical protein
VNGVHKSILDGVVVFPNGVPLVLRDAIGIGHIVDNVFEAVQTLEVFAEHSSYVILSVVVIFNGTIPFGLDLSFVIFLQKERKRWFNSLRELIAVIVCSNFQRRLKSPSLWIFFNDTMITKEV